MITTEMQITFATEPRHDRGRAGHSSQRVAQFAIQEMSPGGPRRIEVYSPSFLDNAVTLEVGRERLKSPSERKHSRGALATVSAVELTHSDTRGTYGTAQVLSEATPQAIEALIRPAFGAALSPIGNTALTFAFDPGEQQQ
jgi:hypothetical protein